MALAQKSMLLDLAIFLHHLAAFQSSFAELVCHEEEKFALLQFKNTLKSDKTSFPSEYCAYPKIETWCVGGNSSNCCSWDGVSCDKETSYVTGLNISRSCLSGTISSNNSIFRLVHLQSLNLAYNNLSFSSIPYGFGNFSSLEYLNLSGTSFSGHSPKDITKLSKLTSLDVSNVESLEISDLFEFIQNITLLRELDLSSVKIPSPLPHFVLNLPSLVSLRLANCGLHGESYLWLSELKNLKILDLSNNSLKGEIPLLAKSAQLTSLSLGYNQLSVEIPTWFENLTQLENLQLSFNNLQGEFPRSLTKLKNLQELRLTKNNLTGSLDFDLFLNLPNLTYLDLSFNPISCLSRTNNRNETHSKLKIISLASCNLTEFPKFLSNLDRLGSLDLSDNKIEGLIPNWIWNKSRENLAYMNICRNLLTGFEYNQTDLNLILPNLLIFDISFNSLGLTLPKPPSPIRVYIASWNFFTGDIPQTFCSLTSLSMLALSNNSLSGVFPSCLIKSTLKVLNLRNNKFHGELPPNSSQDCNLVMIDLAHNLFEGEIPRFLARCKKVEFLNLGYNRMNDTFPYWLSELPNLQILSLCSNNLHDSIMNDPLALNFTKVRFFDISNNRFTGKLPSQLFAKFESMKIIDRGSLSFMHLDEWITIAGYDFNRVYSFVMTIVNKGNQLTYGKILIQLVAIDASNNLFEGSIPKGIGTLQALTMLNFSSNMLRGTIPESLGNLINIEAMDLSQNKLSGQIPTQLADLTFLSIFNVSHNDLSGSIPHGPQFDGLPSSSFEMNEGLCGYALSKKCEVSSTPPVASAEEEDSDDSFHLDRRMTIIGYAVGIIFGVLIGCFTNIKGKLCGLVRSSGGNISRGNRSETQGITSEEITSSGSAMTQFTLASTNGHDDGTPYNGRCNRINFE